ncbi:MAG TPA: glycosyltransferase family 2 protein [Gemmatimonadaceae bacterium]|nr:glycosyltransferase family 2 protein [Gemmatimonadaceae bacterium]
MTHPAVILFVLQATAALVAARRLSAWRHRAAVGLESTERRLADTAVTIVVPTLNEAGRIGPLLERLVHEPPGVVEILIVDAQSHDGTRALVAAAAQRDPRIRLIDEPPLAAGWVGKAWALEHARGVARGDWIVGLDADVVPAAPMSPAMLAAVQAGALDAGSFSPRFGGQSVLERWLHPSLLLSLLCRSAPTSGTRVMANGQCWIARRDILAAHGGFVGVRASFAEDVSLMRMLARRGARVAFLDGSELYEVRSYASAGEMWREWGRSIDLRDSTPVAAQAGDVIMLALVQGLPVPVVIAAAAGASVAAPLVALNGLILVARTLMNVAVRSSYAKHGLSFWLSPLADPLAVIRLVLSSARRPKAWRGRNYETIADRK